MRFTTRDLFWLTLVAGLVLGWWSWWRAVQVPPNGFIRGQVLVSGKPVASGRALLHSEDGQFRGVPITNGIFDLQDVPQGKYRLVFEGDDVPPNKFDAELSGTCQAIDGTYAIGPSAVPPGIASGPQATLK